VLRFSRPVSVRSELLPTEGEFGSDPQGQARPTSVLVNLRRDSLLLLAATVIVGVGNYGFSLALVWILPSVQFAQVASMAALLLVVGTAASASFPWVLAREVSRADGRSTARRNAVGFASVGSTVAGVVAALAVAGFSYSYAPPSVQAPAALAALFIFAASTSTGYLQGSGRFALLASVMVLEVTIKLGLGVGFARWGDGAAGAMWGVAFASGAWVAFTVWVVRHDWRWPRGGVDSRLWHQAKGIGSVQIGVALLATLDVLVGAVTHRGSVLFAGYLAMLVFARVPMFTSSAVSMVVYPRISAGDANTADKSRAAGEALRTYLAVSVATVAVVATLPVRLIEIVLPPQYVSSVHLLLPLTIAGFAAGQINLCTTFFQADGAFRRPVRVLATALPCLLVVLVVASGRSIEALAWAAAIGEMTVAVMVMGLASRRFRGAWIISRSVVGVVASSCAWLALRTTRTWIELWILGSLCLCAIVFAVVNPRRGEPHSRPLVDVVSDRIRWLVTVTADRMRPLGPPAIWRALITARLLGGDKPVLVVPQYKRVLVLAPHPDDETIGCGGTLALLAASGSKVDVVIATRGEAAFVKGAATRSAVGCRRGAAAIEACRTLGVHGPVFLGLQDGTLSCSEGTMASRLAEIIAHLRPDLILVPWMLDEHPDHRALAVCLGSVPMPETAQVWAYEVWGSLPANRLVDVTEHWETKLAALEYHSVLDGSFDMSAHLALQRWRSIFGLFGDGHAEAFLALKPDDYRSLVEQLPA